MARAARTRIFVPEPLAADTEIDLPREAAHHLVAVLRARRGDVVTLFDGHGGEYVAEIVGLERRAARCRVGAFDAVEREADVHVTLYQALARGTKMELVVQKATELGAAGVVPFVAARSNVRLEPAKARERVAHWRRVAVAACEQCGRNRLPEVSEVVDLAALSAGAAAAFYACPKATVHLATAAGEAIGARRQLKVAIGPEGGFSDAENDALEATGFAPVSLGPRVLRTETAGLAALAALGAVALRDGLRRLR